MNKQELYKKRRKQLVEALRSRKYKEGRHQLKRKEQYCCLGVACDVHRKNTRKYKWQRNAYMGSSFSLPVEVARYFGFNDVQGEFNHLNSSNTLAKLNDGGTTFARIADIIEEEPLGLFRDE